MLSPKYFLYFASGIEGQGKIEISSNPKVDAYFLAQSGYQEIHILQPPQPIWIAEILYRKISRLSSNLSSLNFRKWAIRLLNEIYPQKHLKVIHYNVMELKLNEFYAPDLQSLFWGRSLLGTEIPELIKVNGFELPWDPESWLQYFYLQAQVRREAAVSIDDLGLPYCRRCGENKGIIEDNCIFCGNRHCLTCINCQMMGLAKSCIPLYSQPYPDVDNSNRIIKPVLDFELTSPQQRAALALENFWDSAQKQFLVWAVCGGGKTEVSFGIVAKVLSAGGKVLFAIPRKDIVIELLPRFQKAFPEIIIAALYGGSGAHFQNVPLTIATTHQCLRFYQGFDLVILDEADAFPYQDSAMLHHALSRSMKPKGRLVIMTATPNQALIRKAYHGDLPYVSIPARYHRKPLIVPEFIQINLHLPGNSNEVWEPPELIRRFLRELKNNGFKGMIFLPTLKLIEKLGLSLIKWAISQGIPGQIVYSKAPARDSIKDALLKGEILFVVTSTIFERGITVPNLNVLVLFADNETIYDSQTLIQIAGRVGRLGENSQLLFMAKVISNSMREARQNIERMNQEGFELGYLDRN